jgi:hypothetical protein
MVILFAVVTLGKSSASPSRANNFYFVRVASTRTSLPGRKCEPPFDREPRHEILVPKGLTA